MYTGTSFFNPVRLSTSRNTVLLPETEFNHDMLQCKKLHSIVSHIYA